MMGKAQERQKARSLEQVPGIAANVVPTILNTLDDTLFQLINQMYCQVQILLSKKKVDLIRSLEQARAIIYIANVSAQRIPERSKESAQVILESKVLWEILADEEDCPSDMEEDCMNQVYRAGRKKGCSPDFFNVKTKKRGQILKKKYNDKKDKT